MTTPVCYHEHTRTIDSRPSARSFVRRRRRLECKDCGVRFTTVEVSALDLKTIQDWEFEQWINQRITKARRWKGARATGTE